MKTLLKKFSALVIGFLLALILIEAIFRVIPLFLKQTNIKPDLSSYRILCIGDSSTYGLGASDKNKYSYPAQLNKILSKSNKRKIQVFNKGLPGINSSQTLKILKENINKTTPDLILVCTGINDPWNYEESNILTFYKTKSIFHKIQLQLNFYFSKLKTIRFIKLLIININKNKVLQKEPAPEFNTETINKNLKLLTDYKETSKALYKTLKFNFIEMKRLAIKHNCQIYFLEYHAPGWDNPEKIIHYLYKELSLNTIKIKVIFQKLDNINALIRSKDKWHPNNTGYLLLAKIVCNNIANKVKIKVPTFDLQQ